MRGVGDTKYFEVNEVLCEVDFHVGPRCLISASTVAGHGQGRSATAAHQTVADWGLNPFPANRPHGSPVGPCSRNRHSIGYDLRSTSSAVRLDLLRHWVSTASHWSLTFVFCAYLVSYRLQPSLPRGPVILADPVLVSGDKYRTGLDWSGQNSKNKKCTINILARMGPTKLRAQDFPQYHHHQQHCPCPNISRDTFSP
ncbi:hypothetical protein RRG08_039970 [Elysia crispata]|uniref:Uncharacterized protein n=1 Tax=Elysia crispata TaxID=231223 RepID=A0AAE0Z7N3_9GAST|nr:hypothetical protein RRG08_039970 [Elysia crispata]